MGYPQDIRPLTGLRFIAAFWLLLYFFIPRSGLPEGAVPEVIAHGYLGVDLFFVLSGFVLAHVYGPQVLAGRFHYGSFLWARLARVYPLHLACLLMMVGIWAAGTLVGASFAPEAFDLSHIPAHLLLMQAWGVVNADGWNFPSWSISAEWFAYLAFPVLFGAVATLRARPALAAGVTLALFALMFLVMASAFALVLTKMTWQGGALRIIPAFMAGVAMWQLGRTVTLPAWVAPAGLVLAVAWLVLGAEAGFSDALLWYALPLIVFCLAETSKQARGGLIANRTWVWLGEISFAVYMVHLPVDVVYFQFVERVLGHASGEMAALHIVAATIATIVAAAVLHHALERPARDWMRAHPPGFFKAPAPAKA